MAGLDSVDGTTFLGEEDLRNVRSAVANLAGRWKDLGISLGILPSDLDAILSANAHSPSHCLREMLILWLKQNYNVERFGKPTWRRLVEAVEDKVGGNNCALAQTIATEHPGTPGKYDDPLSMEKLRTLPVDEQWYSLGLALGVDTEELDNIQKTEANAFI